MAILFYDLETSGLLKKDLDKDHVSQVRTLQIGWVLCDENTGEEISSNLAFIIPFNSKLYNKENGWVIDEGAYNAHHITLEMCHEYGVRPNVAFLMFNDIIRTANIISGFNISGFDNLIMDIEFSRLNAKFDISNKKVYDIMIANNPIMNLKNRGGYPKYPNLTECYKYYKNTEFIGAHNAMADVRASKEIWIEMKNRGVL